MRIRVLGSAAGGGFPQWNCGCPHCRGVRTGTVAARPRMQESVAVSADGAAWFLLNASPDVRQQIESFPALHPRALRGSPVRGVLLTNGDLDHCLGLLCLREWTPLVVYATERVREGFVEENAFARTLQRAPGQVVWRTLEPGREEELTDADGAPSGLAVEPVPVPGKVPLHFEGRREPHPEDNVALRIREAATGRRLAYCPGVGALGPAVDRALAGADAVFFDGTFWASDELIALGVGSRSAEAMAHVPVGGPRGSLRGLAACPASRRVYIHVNNTNPLLREDSPERAAVEAAGWSVAYDGMEVEL